MHNSRGWLLLLAYLGFVSMGLDGGAHGVAWPYLRADFEVPVGAVGFLLITGTTGSVLASVAAGFAVRRLGVGWLLAGSTGLTVAALVGYALSPGLAFVVAAALFLGAGGGAIDASLNAYVARDFGTRHINWLHASFGAGATVGPLVMTGAIAAGLGWRSGYGTLAAVQALLALAFVITARAWADPPAERMTTPGLPSRRTWALPGLWLGAAAFLVEVAIEMAAALWAYLLLTEGRGMAEHHAGMAVSGFWASLFVGRLLSGVVTDRIGTHRVLTAGIAGMVAGAALVALPAPGWLAVAGLVLIGFAAAPMFPLLTLTTAERVGAAHADRTIGAQVGASALGATTVPAAIGVLIGRVGPEVLGPCLLLLAALLGLIYTVPQWKKGR
jgi:fucose permease